MDEQAVIERMRRWIAEMVIGLNLCPFARRVFEADTIRYVVSAAQDESALLIDLTRELESLASAPIDTIETTLLIHPQVLADFLDYNDFLDRAEQRVAELHLEGVMQIASFHPHYQFADTHADDVANWTNRSPYPMLHILREESISRAATDEAEMLESPCRNIETLRALGKQKLLEMLKRIE